MRERTRWHSARRRTVWSAGAVAAVLIGGLVVRRGVVPAMQVEHAELPRLEDVPSVAWESLTGLRVFFGHQSVGYNVVAGLQQLLADNARIDLRIVETDRPDDYERPIFGHARLGRNGDPRSKLDAFADLMEGGLAERVDIALFKFCYVDITARTDVVGLFERYRQVMGALRAKHPHTLFVHVTVPLCIVQTGPKAWAKRVLGRGDNNLARCRFNALLRKEYAGREPIFDLAEQEATATDGVRWSYPQDECRVYALAPAFSSDGGHLNTVGSRAVAEQLLITLGRAAVNLARPE